MSLCHRNVEEEPLSKREMRAIWFMLLLLYCNYESNFHINSASIIFVIFNSFCQYSQALTST